MTDDNLSLCYNRGCGKKFDPAYNTAGSCKHHPGVPIFHDALKGWSCCNKKSTDFTEFLNTPGCTTGLHSNVKPPEPEKPPESDKSTVVVKETPAPTKAPMERPSEDEALRDIKVTVADSLKSALEQQMQKMVISETNGVDNSQVGGTVTVGTSCKNHGCTKSYQGEESNSEVCRYHPGCPVFHEGLKFWSCCTRRTTEFDTFMSQEGCAQGKHTWFKPKEEKTKATSCRFDWHQTGQFVTISIFCKLALPQKTKIQANQVVVDIDLLFENGEKEFKKKVILGGIINPALSNVKMMGTKVEINLRKAEAMSWGKLDLNS